MINIFKFSTLIVLVCVISACGGTDESNTDFDRISVPRPAGVTSTTLTSFAVEGTSGNQSESLVPLNPAENNGDFFVRWSASAANSIYHAKLYLSEDNILSDSEDLDFLGLNCGSSFSGFTGCSTTANLSCHISNDNMIGCDKGVSPVNITSFLDQIPKDAYMLLEVCNSAFSDCTISSIPIQIQ